MSFRKFGWGLTLSLTLALVVGCNSGKRGGNTAPTSPPPVTPAVVSTLSYSQVALATTQTTAQIGSEVVAMVFSLVNTLGPNDVNLTSVAVTTSGTIDESIFLGGVRLVQDVNGNGVFDQGTDTVISTVVSATTTFPMDNSGVILPISVQTTLTFGASPRQFLVLVETAPSGLSSTSFVGSTLDFYIAASTDIIAEDATGNNADVAGTFATPPPPAVNQVTLVLNRHLLITEICVTPTGAEFIEIFNPTDQPIDLSNCYLTDATAQAPPPPGGAGRLYWLLPTGANFESGSAGNTDFTVQFPATVLAPGQYYVVAVDGIAFLAAFGFLPSAAMRNSNGAPTMLTPTGAAAVHATQPQLTNAAEVVFLFFWDGQSDLVQDHDQVNWGDTFQAVDKTGQSADGPDAGTTTSMYNSEVATTGQDFINPVAGTATPPNSMTRIDYTEMGETKSAGNGIATAPNGARHDESSESVNTTFMTAVANPGGP